MDNEMKTGIRVGDAIIRIVVSWCLTERLSETATSCLSSPQLFGFRFVISGLS